MHQKVGHAGFDRDARHALAAARVAVYAASWRSNTSCTASTPRAPRCLRCASLSARLHRQFDFRTGRDQDDCASIVGCIAQHVAALAISRDLRSRCASGTARSGARRSARVGPCCALERMPSTPRPIRPCRTDASLSMFGIRRRLETCSTDWCVGPSSPRPIESCVNTKIDCAASSAPPCAAHCGCSRRRSGTCRRTG